MKRVKTLIFAGIIAFAASAQQPTSTNYQITSGSLNYYPAFQSQYIEARNVVVWLPSNYSPSVKHDVIYMHDGQMLFDAATTWNHQEWQVDEVMGSLTENGEIRPTIVVGIDNTSNRLGDYFPQKMLKYLPESQRNLIPSGIALKADAYLQFVVNELKPFIDSHYSTYAGPEHTFMLGSSMGGLISLYAICEYPNVFGGVACMSTHVSMNMATEETPTFNNELWAQAFRKYLSAHIPKANSRLIYMDRGTVELDGTYAPYQDAVNTLFFSKGWDTAHFSSHVFIGHLHRETFWAERLAIPLKFLLGR